MQEFLYLLIIAVMFAVLGFVISFLITILYNAATKIKAPVYQYKETVDMHVLRRQPAPDTAPREGTRDGQTGLTDYHLQ
jgi:hypothetical protein